MRTSANQSFAKKAVRPILIATAIGTTPALILLGFAIASSPAPLDPDPEPDRRILGWYFLAHSG
jgi:hypothetical protein